MSRAALLFLPVTVGCASASARPAALSLPQSGDPYFQAAAARAEQTPAAKPRAKNVILFVGDGMGVATITAARIFAGQQRGVDGESFELTLDRAPHTALSRTYSHDYQVADSAATVTAMASGVKTRSGTINVTSAVPYGDCAGQAAATTRTLFEVAEERGLATGVVSTARLTHATPAGVYAHAANRDWENDAKAPAGCADIARQLVEWPFGDGLEIALGGGRANFLPKAAGGARADGRDLTAEWSARSAGHRYVSTAEQLAATDLAAGVRVLGLFNPSHMTYEVERGGTGEPSLAEMTAAAITRLATEPGGYALLVEGGRIDHAHHDGRAAKALIEAVALDEAVAKALSMTDPRDTLIVVTADHSHTLTISGYAARNAPILGLAGAEEGDARAKDGKAYTTLSYANGPGAALDGVRADPAGAETSDPNYRQQALVPLGDETHGGEDVAIFAWGPGSEAFAGSMEENVIFHNVARALGWRTR